MLAVAHQEAIEVCVTEGHVVEISANSLEFGRRVSIYVQPENIEALCDSLLEIMKVAQENALLELTCKEAI